MIYTNQITLYIFNLALGIESPGYQALIERYKHTTPL